ncbi:hypothetical protein NDR87_04065 [Nocardia sp. CDC159]|uniref:DUF6841 domain-containing protein n=1 Tax=Nocardia pulmonis TaxID=2951408 RepID=A0A9X2E2X9_9NOCA|nr:MULTISPECIES: hypothetical protein [Nocardia]MCM6773162.1 hypothetical protein [Nocardia pulmonis]MCM6785535.1 hypothetical protein [Nocardia sp. CDC159]
MNTSPTAALTQEISRWYGSYLDALPEIVSGEVPKLFDYFAVPLLSITSSGAVSLRDAAEVVNQFVTMFEGTHLPEHGHALECGHTIRILNARAAIIAATWEWRDGKGEIGKSIPYENLVADSGNGWRIVVMTQLDPGLGATAASPLPLESRAVPINPQLGA